MDVSLNKYLLHVAGLCFKSMSCATPVSWPRNLYILAVGTLSVPRTENEHPRITQNEQN